MESLNLADLEKEASEKMELTASIKKLQTIVSRVYPGYVVVIEKRDDSVDQAPPGLKEFSSLTGLEQIEQILDGIPDGTDLKTIHQEIERRGGRMSIATLMSVLSKYKDKRFKRIGRGVWANAEGYNLLG